MEKKEQNIKDKFLNLILENGVSLSISVAFCIALYYILHEHNKLLMEQINRLVGEKSELINKLLECYKYNNKVK